MRPFQIIVALDQNRGIGQNGQLPWHLPPDLKHFKDITCQVSSPDKQNAVIMGRKTWESIPDNFRPLSGRSNIVLTRNGQYNLPDDVTRCQTLEEALQQASDQKCEKIFVIGGAQIFTEALAHPACQKLYVTHIDKAFSCDTYFPEFTEFKNVQKTEHLTHQGLPFYFGQYCRK